MSETEDHFACLCEVMRYLIAGDDVAVANLARQQAFFARHIQPWAGEMCDAIAAHPKARFNATWPVSPVPSSAWRRRASICSIPEKNGLFPGWNGHWLLYIAKPLSPTSGVPEARDASALGLGMLAAKAESVPIGYQIHSAS
jgi:hypothetical protein